MLVNKLIHRIISPQIKLNTTSFLFAKEKVQKTNEAPKQAKSPSKDAPKAESKSAPGGTKSKTSPKAGNVKTQQKQVEPMPISFTNQTNSGSLYRGIVKKVQIKSKTGRAMFNDEAFKKIVNIAGPKDLNLIFECYYNYVGHHTILTNRVVDILLNKAINLGTENQQLQEQALNYIFEIYKNHEYLSYYPHYDITIKMAHYAAKLGKFSTVLTILNDKLLVKLNKDAAKQLCSLATDWKDFTTLVKILSYRFNRGLIIDMTNSELLEQIVHGIKNNKNIKFTKPSAEYHKLLSSVDQPSVDLVVAWLVVSGRAHKAASVIKKLNENDPKTKMLIETFLKLEEGKVNNDIRTQFKQLLQNSAYSNLLK